ncbi:hypothetical protein B0J13DRAFT_645978 [Dactylonectria estremocensis]|uniref:DUF6546 domain-containing protein n=1 Tax=Dactylonectria estremocensis TaxID=1079267 RepID=A0A9P9DYR6_9HYPO|nr:hypothetical protein B0J13DRAFT_645978 [Dactylonectria estremocensis]
MSEKNAARLDYIRHLWLRITLSEYICPDCRKPETTETIDRNNQISTRSLTLLLHVLSRWTPNYIGGLTLEISAHSPSDIEHCYRNVLDFDQQRYFHLEEDLRRSLDLMEYTRHRYILLEQAINQHPMGRSSGAAERFWGNPLALTPPQLLPATPIVKVLCLRPHFFRGIALNTLGWLFRDSFINMTTFRFERWAAVTIHREHAFYEDFLANLVHAFPSTLKIFSFNQWTRWDGHDRRLFDTPHVHQPFLQNMVTAYHKLTEFRPPWQLNTRQFLKQLARAKTCEEPKLELLCLECRTLHSTRDQECFTKVLVLVAKVASAMPKLRILEIWNAGPGYGFLFRYTLDPHQARITWRSTHKAMGLEAVVIEAWAKVASEHGVQLLAETDRFSTVGQECKIVDGKSMYRHLVLGRLAVHPVTLAQLETSLPLQRHR